MIEKIIYTLGNLHIKGRESIRACVACMNTLSSHDTLDVETLKAVLGEMDNITVVGTDATCLLGCMQAMDQLLEEVKKNDAHDE